MTFRLANADQLPTYLASLQELLLSRHEGSKLKLDDTFSLEFGDKIKEGWNLVDKLKGFGYLDPRQ